MIFSLILFGFLLLFFHLSPHFGLYSPWHSASWPVAENKQRIKELVKIFLCLIRLGSLPADCETILQEVSNYCLSLLAAEQLRVHFSGLKLYIQDRSRYRTYDMHKCKNEARYIVTLRLMHFQMRNDLALVSVEYTMSGKTAGAIKTTLYTIIYGQHTFGSPNKWEDWKDHISSLYQQQLIDHIFQMKSKEAGEWINRRQNSWRRWLVNNQKESPYYSPSSEL